jgi:hypothetical protein
MAFKLNYHSKNELAGLLAGYLLTKERREAERVLVRVGFDEAGAAAVVAMHLSKYDIVVGNVENVKASILD